MKRYMMTMMVALFAWTGMNAMDYETAREQAYYLTDKMAYELNLNEQQYNDAYEINLDYLLSVRTEADLLDGRYLAYRNADLRHILFDWQWVAYTAVDYLFRPLHWLNGGWYFPVYRHYTHGYYFYHRPAIFWDYRGGHGRFYYGHGFYHDRRPHWNGGLRGEHRGMIGHPHPGNRYGNPGHHNDFRPGNHASFDARTGRFDHHGSNRTNNDFRSNDRSTNSRPNNDMHSNGRSTNSRPENNFRPSTSGRGTGMPGSSRGSGISSSPRGSSISSSPRGSSISSSPRGSNFSGATRGGSVSRSGSMGGHESRGSRGGGRR